MFGFVDVCGVDICSASFAPKQVCRLARFASTSVLPSGSGPKTIQHGVARSQCHRLLRSLAWTPGCLRVQDNPARPPPSPLTRTPSRTQKWGSQHVKRTPPHASATRWARVPAAGPAYFLGFRSREGRPLASGAAAFFSAAGLPLLAAAAAGAAAAAAAGAAGCSGSGSGPRSSSACAAAQGGAVGTGARGGVLGRLAQALGQAVLFLALKPGRRLCGWLALRPTKSTGNHPSTSTA